MYNFINIKNGAFYLGDCLEVMQDIPDGVIDMILCDLPYGTTQNKWDTIIPFDKLWEQYNRVIKENGAIVLTASQPFTSALIMSNLDNFRYEWIWCKTRPVGHLNAKKQPMRAHENIAVFSKNPTDYHAQDLKPCRKVNRRSTSGTNYGNAGTSNIAEFTNYPRTLIEFDHDKEKLHPTQKPVALFEYLIKTYTNAGDIVLDNCAGSGTTAIAAENCGRRWVCVEQDKEYANKAVDRIINHESVAKEEIA